MASMVIEIADAVVCALNGHDFSIPFRAERPKINAPKFELLELGELRACVVPIAERVTILDRDTLDVVYTIDVGLLQRIDPESEATDGLMSLLQEIADHFFRTALPDRDETWQGAEIFYPAREQIKQSKFIGVVRLNFGGQR